MECARVFDASRGWPGSIRDAGRRGKQAAAAMLRSIMETFRPLPANVLLDPHAPLRTLRSRPRPQCRELHAADAAVAHRPHRVHLSEPAVGHSRRSPLHLGGNLCAKPPARVRARPRRHRQGRHRCRDGFQHAGNGRAAFRRSDDGRRAQYAQHAPRCRDDCVHAEACRGEGAGDRHRVRRDRGGGARADGREAARDRHRRSARSGRQAARQAGLRGVHRRRRSGIRMAAPGRRVGRDLAQLHVGHDRQSEGGRLSPSRRVSQCAVEHHRLGDAAPRGLPVDAADVPLQRLVLRLDDGRQRRRQRLLAARRGEGGAGRHPRAQGHPLLRCADRPRRC